MSRISVRMIAMAGMIALALPMGADARGPGGGGGGGGSRGGGGGGGSHGGGGGGGGGFHGGGGGGGARFSAPSISHAAPTFTRSFSQPAFNPGAVRSFSHPAFRAGIPRSFSRTTFYGNRSIAGLRYAPRGMGVNRFTGTRLTGTRFSGTRGALAAQAVRGVGAARLGAPLTGAALAHAGGAQFAAHANGARWQHRGDWRQHRGRFGWAGPLFWPYAYDDLYDDVLWGYGPYYDDPFWAYGYGDIYGAMFSPYGYDELAGWAPPRIRTAARTDGVRGAPSQAGQASPPSQWSAMCGDDTRQVVNLPIDRIDAAVAPDEQQRAALDALANASVQAAQAIKVACPTDVAFTPAGRLAAMERRVLGMVQAVGLLRTPLDGFYDALSDEQKARFNAIGQGERAGESEPRNPSSPAQACGPNAIMPGWPQAQIEKEVRPTEAQRAQLDKLKDASAQAAEMLKAACPAEAAATPPARLAAVASRLDTLLSAVRLVRAALNDFYGSLSDEQKAQFNGIPPMVQNGSPRG